MPYDSFAARGATKASKPDAGKANLRNVPVFAIVKDNVDPVRAGRIRVYIDDLGGADPSNSNCWVTVNPLLPYYGYTDGSGSNTGFGSFTSNPISYGMWFSPPDIGTEVVCMFVNGDPNYGFYIGAPPVPEALRMIPAIGANFEKEDLVFNKGEATSYSDARRLPVTNMNINNKNLVDNVNFLITPKPVHSYLATIMAQQGILRDSIRGPIGTSSQRESPSRVGWGVNTPGRPIYDGGFTDESVADKAGNSEQQSGLKIIGRRVGHSIVMDDGDLVGNDQLVRIRTSLGHQILMSDNGQTLMILHANGQSYIELGKEGTIDMYSTNSVNIRTQGDLNLHADNNINMHASKNLNIFAEEMNIEVDKSFTQKVGADSSIYTMGTHTHKVDKAMSMESGGDASYASQTTTFINGKTRINLNTGETSTVPAVVESIKKVAQTDTVFDTEKGFIAAPLKLPTIVSRAPAHCPWANAGQGVPVNVNLGADSQFPASPNSNVSNANASAGPVQAGQAVTSAGIASVPNVPAVSKALDKTTTGAMVGAMAQAAATGPAAAAVAQGAGVVNTGDGKIIASIGATALSPKQLEVAGYLKPQSSSTINGLINAGASLTQALPSAVFTGKDGVKNLSSLVNSPQAQANATVQVLQKSQTALTNAGAVTGTEGAGAIAGLVMSGATAGIAATLNTVKNAGSSLLGAAQNAAGGLVNKAIAAGNFAANLAGNGLNGLNSIASATTKTFGDVLNAAKGAASTAFNAIKNSLKPFTPDVPQNLKAIASAKEAENQAQTALSGVSGALGAVAGVAATAGAGAISGLTQAANNFNNGVNSLTNINSQTLLKGVGSSATSVQNLASTAIGTAINSVSAPLAAVTNVTSGISKTISSATSASALASGVSNLPGGQAAVTSFNNISTASAQVGNAVSFAANQATGALNNISGAQASLSKLPVGNTVGAIAGGSLQGLQNQAQNLAGDLQNKLKAQGAGLASIVKTGLPPGLASQLQAQIGAVSSVGSSILSIPSVGVDTIDRSQISSQIASTLGNKKIPTPNFTGVISTAATASLSKANDDIVSRAKKVQELEEKYKVQKKIANTAYDELVAARTTLPAGDPKLEELREKAKTEVKKAMDLNDEIAKTASGVA